MSNELHYRYAAIRAEDNTGDSNVVRVIASTDAPVRWGNWTEALAHQEENVDRSSARSVLFNHDRNQLIGGVKSTVCDGKQMIAELEIDPAARTNTGLNLLESIRKGYVRGVSIGYQYSESDCTTTKHVRNDDEGYPVIEYEVIVNRWQLREISVTPTPADVNAQVVRSLPKSFERAADPAPAQEESGMPNSNQNTAPAPQGEKSAVNEIDIERRALEHAKAVVELARSHKLPEPEKYIGSATPEADMLRDLAAAKAREENPKSTVAVEFGQDAGDKARAAAVDGVMHVTGKAEGQDLGMRAGSILEIGRRFLRANGMPVDHLDRNALAKLLLQRDAANVTSGMFTSYVLVNAMNKQVMNGFSAFAPTYPVWTSKRMVNDFKTFYGAGLSAGNLKETVENTTFNELDKAEYGYSGALGLWGATVSLSLQALINDDLSEFTRLVNRAGYIAARTVDKEVYTRLAAATWTNRTAAGDLADATLNGARASLETTADSNSEKLGLTARYLIVPSGLRATAITLVAPAFAGSTAFPTAVLANADLSVVATPFLTTATTASQSTWYLAADQNVVDTCVVAFLSGMEQPQVEEYDAGAAASRKWKIYLPFKVVVPTDLLGMVQRTHA